MSNRQLSFSSSLPPFFKSNFCTAAVIMYHYTLSHLMLWFIYFIFSSFHKRTHLKNTISLFSTAFANDWALSARNLDLFQNHQKFKGNKECTADWRHCVSLSLQALFLPNKVSIIFYVDAVKKINKIKKNPCAWSVEHKIVLCVHVSGKQEAWSGQACSELALHYNNLMLHKMQRCWPNCGWERRHGINLLISPQPWDLSCQNVYGSQPSPC